MNTNKAPASFTNLQQKVDFVNDFIFKDYFQAEILIETISSQGASAESLTKHLLKEYKSEIDFHYIVELRDDYTPEKEEEMQKAHEITFEEMATVVEGVLAELLKKNRITSFVKDGVTLYKGENHE